MLFWAKRGLSRESLEAIDPLPFTMDALTSMSTLRHSHHCSRAGTLLRCGTHDHHVCTTSCHIEDELSSAPNDALRQP